jgi:hypothetical protein
MDELIRKQDALDVTMETVFVEYEDGDPRKEESIILQTKAAIRDRIKALPTVQAEPLTDREQRIFLAAMSREKEVCKEVDYQLSDAREPYEDTLVSVCKEIERKVKAALWTN